MAPNNGEQTSCWSWVARLSTGTILIALSSVVGVLFVQLQAVSYQVAIHASHIEELEARLSQEATKTEQVSQKVDQEHFLTIQHMAGSFVLLTCLITSFHMTAHLRSFLEPDVQRKIVAILFLPPIYGIASFVSLSLPSTHEYMMILKDFYEAYCIYQFLSFLIAVLGRGSREEVVQVLSKHADHFDPPYRCWQRFFYGPNSEMSADVSKSQAVLLECQILTMQFVFVKPILAIVTFVLDLIQETTTTKPEDEESGSFWSFLATANFWIVLFQNISVAFAFAGLLKFYHIVREDLMWCQAFSKFLCIKGVVFMTFWQGVVIAIYIHFQSNDLDGQDSNQQAASAAMVQDILICLEMLFFSLAHWCVFPVDEWSEDYRGRRRVMEKPGIAFGDFVQDVHMVLGHAARGVQHEVLAATSSDTGTSARKRPTSEDTNQEVTTDDSTQPSSETSGLLGP